MPTICTRREAKSITNSVSYVTNPCAKHEPDRSCVNPATSKYYRVMPIDVEVNMKIPSLTVRSPGKPDRKIDNSTVRFTKRITVEAIPKPGHWLSLSTRFGEPFECTVTRTDWNEEKDLFVVSCTYSRRSITADEHHALLTDPDWATKQLS